MTNLREKGIQKTNTGLKNYLFMSNNSYNCKDKVSEENQKCYSSENINTKKAKSVNNEPGGSSKTKRV